MVNIATSGNFSTSYVNGAFTLRIVWAENNINVAGNTSKITATAYLDMTSGASLSVGSRNNTFTINGVNYAFTSPAISKSSGSAKTVTLGSVTSSTIGHNSDGSKSVTVKCSFNINATLGGTKHTSMTASKSVALTKIARLSVLAVSNGTLGTAQNLTITKQDSSYTHTITYTCGTASGTVCTKSSAATVAFTPPLNLASQNTTGTSVSITYKIQTFSGNTSLGSSTKTVTCSIPSSVKPSVTMTVVDSAGLAAIYGNYIKGLSALEIALTVTQAYGSAIKTYKINANGEEYTTDSCTTSALKTAGVQNVTSLITDGRSRSDADVKTITVLDYSSPVVSKMTVKRCNANGVENDQGEYIKVTFSATATALNNKNTATYKIQWKKSSASTYTGITVTALQNNYNVADYSHVFAADSGSSYDVRISIADEFMTIYRTTSASTGFTIMHFKSSGLGMGIGKISEIDNVLDVGFQTRFFGGLKYKAIAAGTDLNTLTTPNLYVCAEWNVAGLINCPFADNQSFTLEVKSIGESGQVHQIITTGHTSNSRVYERISYNGTTWYSWTEYLPRGSCVYLRGASGSSPETISQTGVWQSITLGNVQGGKNYSSNQSNLAFTVSSSGEVTCNFSGMIGLSGSLRLKDGLAAGDIVSIRFLLTRAGNSATYGEVHDSICHAANTHTNVTMPLIFAAAQKGDTFTLQARNLSGARGQTMPTDCSMSIFYL